MTEESRKAIREVLKWSAVRAPSWRSRQLWRAIEEFDGFMDAYENRARRELMVRLMLYTIGMALGMLIAIVGERR